MEEQNRLLFQQQSSIAFDEQNTFYNRIRMINWAEIATIQSKQHMKIMIFIGEAQIKSIISYFKTI
jgi:hypothetical protein